jgi:hypothetical protein
MVLHARAEERYQLEPVADETKLAERTFAQSVEGANVRLNL